MSSRKAGKTFASNETAPEIQLRRRALERLRHSSGIFKLMNDSLVCFKAPPIEQVFSLSIKLWRRLFRPQNCTTIDNSHRKTPMSCVQAEYLCKDGITCIHRSWICDGEQDCPSGDDEMMPNCQNITCRADQYQCADKSCIAGHFHCSGKAECRDGSDELNCRKRFKSSRLQKSHRNSFPILAAPKRTCDRKTEFDCGGGMCIALAKVCDKIQDCPDAEDEPVDKCGRDECKLNNGGCSQLCVDARAGFYCDCRPGFQLVDNRTCEDINECDIPGSCSQICTNERGTFKVSDVPFSIRNKFSSRNHTREFQLNDFPENSQIFSANAWPATRETPGTTRSAKPPKDMHRCSSPVAMTSGKSPSTIVKWLRLWMTPNRPQRSTTSSGPAWFSGATSPSREFTSKFTRIQLLTSVKFNFAVSRAPIDEGTEQIVVLQDKTVTSDGLAVDWIYNHIYFTDTRRFTIEIMNFDGNMGKILIKDDVEIPRAIALDPLDGWMYWSDWGSSPRIERAGMDGTHREVIVSFDVKWPNGLTLDLVRKRVYWVSW